MSNARKKATKIVKKLQNAGFDAFFAGGCVRDSLLGVEPKDFDIATSATPDEVEALFSLTIPVGKAFGVVIVVDNGDEFEVATFRTDGTYADGRRPDSVEFAGIELDANRRDFTINALFENPITGEVLDFVGGVEDLKNGVLRTVGNPADRFSEDALRVLRLARFAARFNCNVDQATFEAAVLLAGNVRNVSAERVGDELSKILTGPNPEVGVNVLRATGVLEVVLPEVCQ